MKDDKSWEYVSLVHYLIALDLAVSFDSLMVVCHSSFNKYDITVMYLFYYGKSADFPVSSLSI